ncbi:MAG: lipid-binding SYLF domain-containing protein [Acidobacteriales bacterium]|nr:lipid-binding SYLF domain-containing protein [Terriglobales bacterium]
MKRILAVLIMMSVALTASAEKGDKEKERLGEAGQVMKEIMGIPEGIPQDLLDKAECVVVLPSVKKLAFGIGASYGRGAMTCRTGEEFTGAWGQPIMIALEGGSIGLQLGGQETDFVLLLMSPRSANAVLTSKVKLGADASAAAGPKGRESSAATDATMRAEILSYSRARGLFLGISLAGSTLRPDGGANENLFGHEINAKKQIQQSGSGLLVKILNEKSPTNKSDKESLKNAPKRSK